MIVPVQYPEKATAFSFSISPSPLWGSTLHIAVDSPFAGDYQCFIKDQTGQILFQRQVHLSAGPQQIEMEAALPAGVFYVYLTSENARSRVSKIVKI